MLVTGANIKNLNKENDNLKLAIKRINSPEADYFFVFDRPRTRSSLGFRVPVNPLRAIYDFAFRFSLLPRSARR